MAKKSWLFDLYLALIGNGHSAEEAKLFITQTFPNVDQLELVAILDNLGDVGKAEDDYANKVFRAKVAELKENGHRDNGPRGKLATRMFGEEAFRDG